MSSDQNRSRPAAITVGVKIQRYSDRVILTLQTGALTRKIVGDICEILVVAKAIYVVFLVVLRVYTIY